MILWLQLSGLPLHLNTAAKLPYAWALFATIAELDERANPARPAAVEIPLAELGALCGLDEGQVAKGIKALRKAGLVRAFLPDNAEEPALLQVITPVQPPLPADAVRAAHPDLFLEAPWPPRYAVHIDEPGEHAASDASAKIKRVVDLYLNTFSMKMNSIILDQLQIIAQRYDSDLIAKVFHRAQKAEASSLGWVLAEIRKESKLLMKAAELRRASTSAL